jgi:hypothetical protein
MTNIIHQIAAKELKKLKKKEIIVRQGDFSEFTIVLDERLKNVKKYREQDMQNIFRRAK